MWPTFYIPLAIQFAADANVSHLCGTIDRDSLLSIIVPNPPGMSAGDTQLVQISYFGGGGDTWPTTGWREIFEGSLIAGAGSYGNGLQRVFWRQWNGTDPDFEITPPGSVSIAYVSIAIRNQNTADPIFTGYLFNPHETPDYTHCPTGPAQYLECANLGDLFFQFENNTPSYSAADEPDSADVEFACTNEVDAVPGPGAGHTLAGIYSTQDANNLFDYSDLDPIGWTANGLVRSVTARSSTVMPSCKVVGNNAGGTHYFEKTVTLEAGKTYAFLLNYTAFNAGGTSRIWMTHIRPDNTEHGIGFTYAGTTRYTVPGSTDVSATGDRIVMVAPVGDAATDDFGYVLGYLFDAASAGDYKFRIHWTGNVSDPNTSSDAGFFAQLFVNAVALVEGPTKMQVPTMLPTSGAAILPGSTPYILPRPPKVSPAAVAFYPWSAFVLRRAGGTRPLCRLMNQQFRNVYVRFDDNTITDSRFMAQKTEPGNVGIRTSHSVYSFLSQQKFYMELEVNTFGTGSANDVYTIGACPMEAAVTRSGLTVSGTPPIHGDLPGQYSYTATGKTFTDGTQDGGTVTGWSIGDYIGMGIDFSAMEITFYRNGTLLKTQAINSAYADKMWVGLFGFFSLYAADKQARFTYNFKGPFGGRKPSGFVAFDFDNEVP